MATKRITGSEAVILSLLEEGVDTIFGILAGQSCQFMMPSMITIKKLSTS